MYQVFDTEEGRYVDVRELEKDICVVDSTTYFDKRHAQKFTTISLKSKFRTLWSDFWSKKDKSNIKLVQAASKGDLRKVQKLLNRLRGGYNYGDANFCDESGFSALHAAAKHNHYDVMDLLLSMGELDVNMLTHNEDMLSPLHIAVIE